MFKDTVIIFTNQRRSVSLGELEENHTVKRNFIIWLKKSSTLFFFCQYELSGNVICATME